MKMERCPNPACEGGEDSLEIVEDDRCTRDRCCWVRCDWCGVAGPTAGTSDESAIEAWNSLPRINSGEEVDGPVYNAGRDEGRSDVCAVLRAILDSDDKHHWNIDGVLKEVERLKVSKGH